MKELPHMPAMGDREVHDRSVGQFSRDLWLLMKPELTLLSVFTSLGSAYLAIGVPDVSQLLVFPLLAIGTLLVGGGSGALNQYLEREYDSLMKRTEKRPVPDARVTPGEALAFGVITSVAGIVILSFINLLTAGLAALTLSSYIFLYTPLKRISTLSTIIGAIPGALPTLIGWASIQNALSYQSLTLFAILFYWQMPHFYSIGWLYRNDYQKAGYRLLTSIDTTGRKVSRAVILNQLMLGVVSLSPAVVGIVETGFIYVSVLISLAFLLFGILFTRNVGTDASGSWARMLFFSSLFYLPITFSAMIIFKIHHQ
ncbi:MAG: protoheme IX farnesyltransferase [Bryobacteraceae bacterium]|nr:protoheme IX farnesyltransferase [Bryobacteraceae bacterium]